MCISDDPNPMSNVELKSCINNASPQSSFLFLSARKADLKKGFQHLVVVVLVVVGTQVKKQVCSIGSCDTSNWDSV
jgi:hypothetical protein